MKTIIWTLLTLLSLAVHSKGGDPKTRITEKALCGENKITDLTVNHSQGQCKKCPVCPIDEGSTFPCGGVRKNDSKPIKCERCKNGKTFSNSSSTDMCSPCTDCSLHNRKVLDTCTTSHNTVCGECEDGYYESPGVLNKERCTTEKNQESPTTMTHHNDTLSTQSISASDGPNVVVAAVVPVVIVIILGVVVAVIVWHRYCRKNNNEPVPSVNYDLIVDRAKGTQRETIEPQSRNQPSGNLLENERRV